MQRIQIIIQGKVQGVFFRAFVKECAQKLNIKGYAKNLDHDKVEIVAEGNAIKEFIEYCKKGPRQADIHNITTIPSISKEEFHNFSIRY
jgi:acylphosphatase